MEVSAEASNYNEAIKIFRKSIPDLAIIDISLKDTSGIELVKDVKKQFDDFPILVLSMHSESLYAERALRAGARGYIMKHEPAEKIMSAIRCVLSGKIHLSEEMSEQIIGGFIGGGHPDSDSLIGNLSDRELEVFNMVGKGLTPKEIADKLYLSVKTIETYYSRLKQKLNLKSAAVLHRLSIRWHKQDDVF